MSSTGDFLRALLELLVKNHIRLRILIVCVKTDSVSYEFRLMGSWGQSLLQLMAGEGADFNRETDHELILGGEDRRESRGWENSLAHTQQGGQTHW